MDPVCAELTASRGTQTSISQPVADPMGTKRTDVVAVVEPGHDDAVRTVGTQTAWSDVRVLRPVPVRRILFGKDAQGNRR